MAEFVRTILAPVFENFQSFSNIFFEHPRRNYFRTMVHSKEPFETLTLR